MLHFKIYNNHFYLIDILGFENLRLGQSSSSDSTKELDLECLTVSGSRLLAQEMLLPLLLIRQFPIKSSSLGSYYQDCEKRCGF